MVVPCDDADNVLETFPEVTIELEVDFELDEGFDFIVIGFPPWLWWEGKLIVFTLEDKLLVARLLLLDNEALTIDREDECLLVVLVVKDVMERLLFPSMECCFLFGWAVLLNNAPLVVLELLPFFDNVNGSLSRLKASILPSESLSFAIGFPPPALEDFRSGTIDMLPPGRLREIELELVDIEPLSSVGTFLIDNLGLPSM